MGDLFGLEGAGFESEPASEEVVTLFLPHHLALSLSVALCSQALATIAFAAES